MGENALSAVGSCPTGGSGGGVADQRRPEGLTKGLFHVPDDFDAPLPDDVLAAFEGNGGEDGA
jgi:hypothetical protein